MLRAAELDSNQQKKPTASSKQLEAVDLKPRSKIGNMFSFDIIAETKSTRARAGVIQTARGPVGPAFIFF